jgi:hypothetical protein
MPWKTTFAGMLCLVLMGSCSLTESSQIKVEGQIHHLGRTMIRVSYYINDHTIAYDSVFSTPAGKFKFSVPGTNEVNPVTLFFPDSKNWTTLFAKKGDVIHMYGNIERIDLLTVQGGAVNDDLTRFKQDISLLYLERQQIIDGIYQNGGQSVEMRLAEINLTLKRKAKEFVLEHPTSVASVVLIQDFFYQEYDPNTAELLSILEGDAKECHLAQRLLQGLSEW